ncbi:MAG: endonuclease V [candidate division Zixibacteria bacterium]|nr:endonuclease V [candidate division Zixibacteria bacterium]
MRFSRLHQWTDDPREADKIQDRFRSLISLKPERTDFKLVGGADVAYSKKDNMAFATVVVLKVPEMDLVEKVRAQANVTFPFMPGYFYFREGPVLVKALARLKIVPDCFIFDAHGIGHPKGIGMASHLGLLLDMPSIGCAKKLLCGEAGELGNEVGDTTPIHNGNREVGCAVRSRQNVKPLYVSPGHKIDIETAVRTVIDLLRGYRLPEPLRLAHVMANKQRRNYDNNLSFARR